jgi:prepilin-type N-terminal cleavage/methylation domain-containing protein
MCRRNAFTLVELLVTISIISLLIAVLLPTLSGARRAARSAACLSNVRQLTLATHTYAMDFSGVPPMARWNGRHWMMYLEPYYASTDVLLCPEAATRPAELGDGAGVGEFMAWERWDPVSFVPRRVWRGSYGYNGWMSRDGVRDPENYPGFYFGAMDGHPLMSTIPVFGDARNQLAYPEQNNGPESPQIGVFVLRQRHAAESINLAFADGSAARVKVFDLWNYRWSRRFEPQGTKDF